MITIESILSIFLTIYVLPFIIIIIGYYVNFKGETLQEFISKITYTEQYDYHKNTASDLEISLIPGINFFIAIVFVIKGSVMLIKFIFKLIFIIVIKQSGIWDKLKNKKIKNNNSIWNI